MKKLIGMLAMLYLCLLAVGVSQAELITFQQNVGGYTGTQDTVLRSGTKDGAVGITANNVWAGYYTSATYLNNHALVRFDGIAMPALNPGETIQFNSAKIVLTVYDGSGEDYSTTGGNYGFGLGVYEIKAANASWTQGTTTAQGATWNYKNRHLSGAAANWAGGANGCNTASDIVTTPMSTVIAPASANADGAKMEFAIDTALVQTWLSGTNAGVLIKGVTAETANKYRRFYSSENIAQADRRPQLVIDYTVVPEPATVAILGLGGLAAFARRKQNRS